MIDDQQTAPRWLASVITLLAVIALVVMACLSWSGSFRDILTVIPGKAITQTTSAGEVVNSPTPAVSRSATPTMAPLQPATPEPPQEPIHTNIFIPAVVNSGAPAEPNPATAAIDTSPTSAPPAPPSKLPAKGKAILVDISDQRVYAYEKGKLIYDFVASTGRKNTTQPGRYKILDKIPKAYSDPWGFWMPYWMGFDYVGKNLENGFHSLPVLPSGAQIWGKKIGTPITYGCVVLKPDDMKKLYRWAGVGTAVVIQK